MQAQIDTLDNESLETVKAFYEKKSKRLDKIIKQSDKQQFQLIKLNTIIEEQQKKLSELYDYNIFQQNIAKEKLESLIINDYQNFSKVIFKASDILSGDYYSIYKLKNGDTFMYLIDGQGHGIAPALTIHAISSNILQMIHSLKNFNTFELFIEKLFFEIQKFLGDEEQLSYIFTYIKKDSSAMKYLSGGMYPFLIKTQQTTNRYKANNLPFMNFSPIPVVQEIKLENTYENILLYSDGFVEELNNEMKTYTPQTILNDKELLKPLNKYIQNSSFDDDITIIYFLNPNQDNS